MADRSPSGSSWLDRASQYILNESWPARAIQEAYSAATLPGDVYAGKVDPFSDEAIKRSADLAGFATLGAGAFPSSGETLRAGFPGVSKLYRETSPSGALEFMPGSASTVSRGIHSDVYHLADDQSLALGQGANRGVTMVLDPMAFDLAPNTSKPGLAFSAAQNAGREFTGVLTRDADAKGAVSQFVIDPSRIDPRDPMVRQLSAVAAGLEKSGWIKSVDDGGRMIYSRPEQPRAQATNRPLSGPPTKAAPTDAQLDLEMQMLLGGSQSTASAIPSFSSILGRK